MTNPATTRIADEIRHVYVTSYRAACYPRSQDYGTKPIARWDGGRDAGGKRFKPVWPMLAELFIARHVDPSLIIQLGFRMWQRSSPPAPPPDYFKGEQVFIAYAEHQPTLLRQTETEFLSASESLKTYIVLWTAHWLSKGRSLDQLMISALQDHVEVHASSLFRYVMAMSCNLPHVAEVYKGDALRQYVLSRSLYDNGWREVIPAELRQLADQLSRQGGAA